MLLLPFTVVPFLRRCKAPRFFCFHRNLGTSQIQTHLSEQEVAEVRQHNVKSVEVRCMQASRNWYQLLICARNEFRDPLLTRSAECLCCYGFRGLLSHVFLKSLY